MKKLLLPSICACVIAAASYFSLALFEPGDRHEQSRIHAPVSGSPVLEEGLRGTHVPPASTQREGRPGVSIAVASPPAPRAPSAALESRERPSISATLQPPAYSAENTCKDAAGEVEFQLARGVRQPVAALGTDRELTPAQADAVAGIASTFLSTIASAATSLPSDPRTQLLLGENGTVTRFFIENPEQAGELDKFWRQLQDDADSHYRNIFGEAAYQQRGTNAAVKALGLEPEPKGSQ